MKSSSGQARCALGAALMLGLLLSAPVKAATNGLSNHLVFQFNLIPGFNGIQDIYIETNAGSAWGEQVAAGLTSATLAENRPWAGTAFLPSRAVLLGTTVGLPGALDPNEQHVVFVMSNAAAAVVSGRDWPFGSFTDERRAIDVLKGLSRTDPDSVPGQVSFLSRLVSTAPQVFDYQPVPCPPPPPWVPPPPNPSSCTIPVPVAVPPIWTDVAVQGASTTGNESNSFAVVAFSTGKIVGNGTLSLISTVPEPHSALLFLLGVAALMNYRQKGRC